jgi:hypothetical protein
MLDSLTVHAVTSVADQLGMRTQTVLAWYLLGKAFSVLATCATLVLCFRWLLSGIRMIIMQAVDGHELFYALERLTHTYPTGADFAKASRIMSEHWHESSIKAVK